MGSAGIMHTESCCSMQSAFIKTGVLGLLAVTVWTCDSPLEPKASVHPGMARQLSPAGEGRAAAPAFTGLQRSGAAGQLEAYFIPRGMPLQNWTIKESGPDTLKVELLQDAPMPSTGHGAGAGQ